MAMYSFSVSTIRTHIRMHHTNGVDTCSILASNTHASHQRPSLLLIGLCYQQLQANTPSTLPLLVPPFSHNHPLPSQVSIWLFFLGFASFLLDVHCRNKIPGHGGAWHIRLEEAQKVSSHACPITIRKELT